MAKMRVHDLAKEYGMQSKELLEHLADMKIPAKSASSTLEDAYISIVRKKLQPIMEARAAEIAAQKAAEEEAAAKEAKAAAEAAEAERLAAEARREAERAEEEKKRAKEEAARKKEEERRRAEEEKKRLEAEEAERNRVKDTAPKAAPSFNRRMLYKVMALFSCFFYNKVTILYILSLYRIPTTCLDSVITYAICISLSIPIFIIYPNISHRIPLFVCNLSCYSDKRIHIVIPP